MNKRGLALIFGLLVVVVLSILSASFFLRSMNENNLVKRYVNSTRALWLAEAGVAEAIISLPNSPSPGTLGGANYKYEATTTNPEPDVYRIESEGSSVNIKRKIIVYVKTTPVNPNNFSKPIEVNGDLKVGGAATIKPLCADETYNCYENANLSFSGKFTFSAEELKAAANRYYLNPDPNVVVVDEITWVDVDAGKSMTTRTDWTGKGILIINGNADITGGTFDGIIWVIGTLRMSGNPTINGAIFAECDADIDTQVTGKVIINHDVDAITKALEPLSFLRITRLSWNESP